MLYLSINVGMVRSSFTLCRTFAVVTEALGPLTHCVVLSSSELEAFDQHPKTHLCPGGKVHK